MLLTVKQAAERLNCSVSIVYGLIETHQLAHFRCPGIRVSDVQLTEFLESRRKESAPRQKKADPPPAGRPFVNLDGDRLLAAWRQQGADAAS